MGDSQIASTSKTTNEAGHIKACDACSHRRVRCEIQSNGVCLQCERRNMVCEYTRIPRKKGPPGKRITELQKKPEAERKSTAKLENQPQFAPTLFPPLDEPTFDTWNLPEAVYPALPTETPAQPIPFLSELAHGVGLQQTEPLHLHETPTNFDPDWLGYVSTPNSGTPFESEDFSSAVDQFFLRLDPTIAAFSKEWLVQRVLNQEHVHDRILLGMLLAMKALVLVQPLDAEGAENNLTGNPIARTLMKRAVECRYDAQVGEHPSVDGCLGAFYLFACEFGLGKFGSAWIYLQEALSLAQLLKVQDLQSYTALLVDETERRLRLYWLLAVTERAFALQRHHSISFGGGIYRLNSEVVASIVSKEPNDYLARRLLIFDAIDERILDCWNGRCHVSDCSTLSPQGITAIHTILSANGRELGESWVSASEQSNIQACDLGITSTWLQTRLWLISYHHGLIVDDAQLEYLRPTLALELAYAAMGICRQTPLHCLEACGIGIVEKLHDIAKTAIRAWQLFPSAIQSFRHAIRDLLQVFLATFMLFRGGRHAYLGLLSQDIAALGIPA